MIYLYATLMGAIAGITAGYLVYVASVPQACADMDGRILALSTIAYFMGMIAGMAFTLFAKCMIDVRDR